MQNKKDTILNKEVGSRFRKFRESLRKTQLQLATELNVYQSTITNIEKGKTFPKISYLSHFYEKYRLNMNWLMTGKGDMLVPDVLDKQGNLIFSGGHVKPDDPMYEKYVELLTFMQIPVVEQVILAKLVEIKFLLKDEIKEFQAKLDAGKNEETG